MSKGWIAAAATGLSLAVAGSASPAATSSRQDVTIKMSDGVSLAATLFEPAGSPPAGGWPAVILMHGLGGDRSSMNALAGAMGLVGDQYVVLTFDARGHGASGGLIGIDGPRETADVREVFDWLAARQEVARTKIGAFGISYGGAAALNSLVAGVPWATVEVAETWTDLYSALAAGRLPKSGIVGGFLAELPPGKLDPSLIPIRDDAFADKNLGAVRSWAAARSSLSRLHGKRTPSFFMQGRRDFAFGIDQAARGYALLAGPKRLWIGNHGHPPSTFPAADTPKMLVEGKKWFDRFLRGVKNGIDRSKPVTVAAEDSARVERFPALPRTVVLRGTTGGRSTIIRAGTVVRSLGRTRTAVEVFGSPKVRVDGTALAGWSRLVAVLSARTPSGSQVIVADGGTSTRPGRRMYAFGLQSQATFVPKGSRLTLTLGASSTAQSPSNLVYLDLPMPAGARLEVGTATVELPTLARPVTR
ncbi:MAG: alpha/beta fold hydrolase [Actinobacteria bacterium]|nr:MAG: alpha/beta fold hydrolase [Actinomycetota bacterium]